MPRAFAVTLRERTTDRQLNISGEIPDDDWETLMVYADEVVALESMRVFQNGVNVHFSLKWDAGTRQLRFEGDLPPDEDIFAILHRLRPFILQKERANFYRIVKMLSRHLDDAIARAVLKRQRDLYSGKDFQEQLTIQWQSESQRVVVNAEETVMKWLNAYEYHQDEQKRQEIEEIDRLLPRGAPRAIFVSMLLDKIKAIINVAVLIRTIERSDEVPLIV